MATDVNITDETHLLAEAKARHEAKARATTITTGAPLKETLDTALKRLESLPPLVVAPMSAPQTERAKQLLKEAGIPPLHSRINIAESEHPWNVARNKLVAKLGNGFAVALSGVQGVGKTQLGVALIQAAASKMLTVKYAVAMDFFIAVQDNFDDKARSQASVIASFVKPQLLVLDEMDERSESAWENRLLFHMINKRYNNLVDTLLISRRSEAEFLMSLGDSLQSRIQETGGSMVCDWASWREVAV